jgi:3-hydroxy-9,10-secoandrosta-1,3,5(10)-triene-9,17-dione monooxygenase
LTLAAVPVGRDEVLRRAAALVPVLRDRSAAAEAGRSCPPETVADFEAAGLFAICQPARYGGFELGWDVLCEVSQTLARGCGSQAWVQNVLSDHAQKVGAFPRRAQDDVWGDTPNARVSASFDPVGRGRAVDGGVIFSGRHGFSSGIDHAQWILCGGHRYDGDVRGERCFFLLRKSEVTVIDDWHVVGLAGTGSKSFEAVDVFVPEHRIMRGTDSEDGTGPGGQENLAPVFRLPRGGITSTGFAAVAVGIAEGFLADYLAYTRPRRSRGTPVAGLMGTQMSVGVACAQIESAAMIYLASARDAMRTLEAGRIVTKQQKLRAKRDSTYATQLALDAVSRLFNQAGGRALYANSTMQRRFRDLLGAASHHSLVWDAVSTEYGRFALEELAGPE